MTDRVTDDDAAPTMSVGVLRQQRVDGAGGHLVVGVARVTLDVADRLAEHATGVVDLLDGELHAGELGRAEEGERAGLRAAACRR